MEVTTLSTQTLVIASFCACPTRTPRLLWTLETMKMITSFPASHSTLWSASRPTTTCVRREWRQWPTTRGSTPIGWMSCWASWSSSCSWPSASPSAPTALTITAGDRPGEDNRPMFTGIADRGVNKKYYQLIHSANPQSRPVVITVFAHVVRPSVPTFQI